MKNIIDINKSLGEIVTAYPSTVPELSRYKLDYCCGGKDTLAEALKNMNLNEQAVINDLEKAVEQAIESDKVTRDWSGASMSTIISHILNTHHVFMKEALAELNNLMFKILKVHFKTDGETLLQVHHLFGNLKTELEAHLVKEEENLFPMIIEYEKNNSDSLKSQILKFIEETESEHDTAGDVFKELAKITGDYTAPSNACGSYRRTYYLLNDLEKDTFNHIHLENTVLFGKL
ncbi:MULTISPECIES: iron-sulfur cluster repair di-iron protein [unclassified Oceanispirochaeta]|uniref:iron-sulfur cluster repair di-iron protein n=1 Tax=unclassified Oceanispirochaeta TaxID=2635722 RepID=UPI000E09C99A|nr:MULTISPECIES: iron-sulfur cluster repair di-iron protein [unclassified Oceanispirochaeta]MBF9017421.1 iron-sulfur cluster repair di-iron protein [Oceanispirochaeta sp. M2]NPD73993.1 iron-sulfur cluster repair di-iron protein [Oceanispirochaeta sp. M1]RDG30168.1 iron-sulfur cluster repair di-iron protein [Oceanispirochaeta sp. M1]